MTPNGSPSPDADPDDHDLGDETARRYRFQWTYAAIMSCMLLDDTEDVQEVFCEQHEDVLLKHTDNTFTGVQVKTRGANQEVWKTRHEPISSACARFAALEEEFPNNFRSYRLLTNHPFYSAQNGQDLPYVLEVIRAADTCFDVNGGPGRFLRKTATEAECSDATAFRALSKTRAKDDLPKLPDASTRLISTLTQVWPGAESYSYAEVKEAAQALVTACANASSLQSDDFLLAYIPARPSPKSVLSAAA